jgi:hypothetical protein
VGHVLCAAKQGKISMTEPLLRMKLEFMQIVSIPPLAFSMMTSPGASM